MEKNMPISEDLRNVQKIVAGLDNSNQALINIVLDNLAALADQVEALEDTPLAMPAKQEFQPEHNLALIGLQAPLQ